MFPLKQLVDFPLRCGTAINGLLVGFFGSADFGSRVADVGL